MKKSGRKPSLVAIFGSNVRRIRRAQDLTQEQLAERLDAHRTFVSYVERSPKTQRDIGLSYVERFSEALGVPVVDLITAVEPTLKKRSARHLSTQN